MNTYKEWQYRELIATLEGRSPLEIEQMRAEFFKKKQNKQQSVNVVSPKVDTINQEKK